MTTQEIISKNIQNLRKKNKMTQSELADKLNYTEQAISKWERGLSLPDAATLLTVANLFQVPIEYMYKEHSFSDLSTEEEKMLKAKEIRIKVIFILSIFLLIIIITATMLSNFLKEIGQEDKRMFVFILPILLSVICIINHFLGKKKFTMLFISLIIWNTANSFYVVFFNTSHITLVFAIAAILQATLLTFPLIDKYILTQKNNIKK